MTSTEKTNTRNVFLGWSGDFEGKSPKVSLTMDKPKKITANWRTEHLIKIESEFGEPVGNGWHESGSKANISVNPVEGTVIRHVFTGWSGDFTSDSAKASVNVSSPMVIKANWRTDYSMLNIGLGTLFLLKTH